MQAESQRQGLYLFREPYDRCEPVELGWRPAAPMPGAAVVWHLAARGEAYAELEWLWERPRSLPLFVILPEPEDVPPLAPIVRSIPELAPRAVLPFAPVGTTTALRILLAAGPRSLSRSATGLLRRMGAIPDAETGRRVETIFARAAHVRSIDGLSDSLCQSRRTLGRFFSDRSLPVPSHWLQFGRVLHASVQLQNTTTNINRIAGRFGYPDGFTMSNSMKRLTGYRPSFVRRNLGWEWIVAAWWKNERQ